MGTREEREGRAGKGREGWKGVKEGRKWRKGEIERETGKKINRIEKEEY